MIINIVFSVLFLLLLGSTIINGRYVRAGIGETPLIYRSSIVKFFLNLSMLSLIALSIYLIFFYNWKLFLLLLFIGFLTETLIIIPIIEKSLYLMYKKLHRIGQE